ncbi:hypothetical protein [Micromonospora fluostatini]|uniref:hypothetical protein n=1 Tax=Micromonospora sp. JCM 30529 TaxID=3421643 RepID=UPI003D171052
MSDTADTKQPRVPRPVRRLTKRLDVARQLHDLEQDAALDIVDIERLRVSVTRSLWVFLAVGSVFTTTGVQDFLAGHLTPADPVWWGTWGVEPCLVGILITVLRWEAAMIARGIDIDSKAVDWLKRFLLTCTLIMNVVPALWPREGEINAGMLAAHIMVPVLVFFLAEVMPIVQARCTQARRAITLTKTEPTAPEPAASTPVASVLAVSTSPPPVTPAARVEAPAARPSETSTPTPVASVEPPTPAVELDGLGIPMPMQAQIRQLIADSTTTVTAADIQRATRLPLPIAARVVDRLTPVTANGYAH